MAATGRVPHTRRIAGVAVWQWLALLLGAALLVLALVLGRSPTKAVASVDGQPITVATFDRWLVAAAVSVHASDNSVPAFPPDAPSYSRCIAFERTAATKGGGKAPSTATLRGDCRTIRVSLAEQVMQFLISGEWYIQQGARERIEVSAAQIRNAMHSSFPKTSGLLHFLSSSGLDRADLQFEARAALIAQRLDARHGGPVPTISAAQIAAYYNSNRSQMGGESLAQATPAIRQLLIVQAQAPTLDKYLSTVQRYWQPRTSCASGYRIAYYCRAS